MTEQSPTTERRRPARPSASNTFAAGITLFVAVLAVLAWQVRVGRDPSLDAKRPALASATAAPKPVLVRVIHRRVIKEKIVYIPPTGSAAAAAGGGTSYASAPASSSSPSVQTYSAPAASAPAPVAAPAPAPAPVVTATS